MKIVIPRAKLIALIGKIQNIIPSKPAIPILVNVLMEAVDDQLILSASDLTVSMRVFTDATILEEGAITLPAKHFFPLIRELTAPQIEIHTLSPEIALVSAGSSHFRIHGMHKGEFPDLPNLSEGHQFTVPSTSLKELLTRSSFAAAKEDNRQAINGVLLQYAQKTATFTATDGKRLAKIHSASDVPSEFSGSYIIPLKAVEEMIRMLDPKEEESAKITLMADKIALEVHSTTLISKLLSGQFPDVNRVIPQKREQLLSLHREELMSLLRQIALFTEDSGTPIRFSFSTGELHLSVATGKIGEGNVKMPVNYVGEKLDIAFNPVLFLDILRHCKDETVTFSVSDPWNPGMITDSTTAQFVIMPMRL